VKKLLFVIIYLSVISDLSASIKENIIKKFSDIKNVSFDFEQNINGKIEKGNCVIEYPKKIYCRYNLSNQKVLVADGKSLVIKTLSSYYFYPLEKTPLDTILNKEYLIKKITNLDQRDIGDNFINFNFVENENEINLFFDKKTFNLIGWQTVDIYQNVSITYLSSIKRNQKLNKEIFKLPKQN
jgi:outer membrane lipoprotein-sorting protein